MMNTYLLIILLVGIITHARLLIKYVKLKNAQHAEIERLTTKIEYYLQAGETLRQTLSAPVQTHDWAAMSHYKN